MGYLWPFVSTRLISGSLDSKGSPYRPYAITFLPPGSFLLQLYSAFDDDLQGICSYSVLYWYR